ncbi:MAG: DUF2490 domain-containing protein [Candidatus Omnitrophica bacterium]|nr:DUF2490 domain-containing protein [Candidatus Omnitrophota bacterium]
MKKTILIIVSLILTAVINAWAYDNHDFQVWNTDLEECKLTRNSKLSVEQEFRWGNNGGDFYYQHYDVGYIYLVNDYFHFGAGFRYIKQKIEDKFKDSSDPYLTAFMFWNPAGFSLSNRMRLEYRYKDYQGDSTVFRNKLDIKFPWKFSRLAIQPMVADEIFYRFKEGDLGENRLFAGLAFKPFRNISAEVFYMLRSTKNLGIWSETNVLGTKLKLSF